MIPILVDRSTICALLIFVWMSLGSALSLQAQDDAAELIVGRTLDKLTERLDEITDKAERAGDFLVEKNARMLHLLTQNIRNQLADQKDEALDRLSVEHQKLLSQTRGLIDETSQLSNRMLDFEDFLALDLSEALNLLPVGLSKSRVAALRRIDGYSQIHQEEGVYQFRIIGNVFGPGYRCNAVVNGIPVKSLDMKTSKAHTLEFDVPVEALNGQFRDEQVNRVDLELECFKTDSDKPLLNHKAKILLLPKYPIQYELIEHKQKPVWSKEVYWTAESRGSITRKGQVTVSARVPDGCLMLKDTVTCFPPTERLEKENLQVQRHNKNPKLLAWTEEIGFSDEDRVVSRTLKFFGAERKPPLETTIKVQYRKPTTMSVDEPANIEGALPNRRLPFGTSFVRFGEGHQSHTLRLHWFNGKKAILTPTRSSSPGVRVESENLKEFHRLAIHVDWPDAKR